MKLYDIFVIKKTRKRGIHKSKRDFQLKIAEWIYPSIGIIPWVKYLALSLKRKPLSSHKIALGFAFGALVSFTPYMGLHGLLAILLAYMFSASIVSAIIGTIIGNPWTFPLIWAWSLNLGNFILGNGSSQSTANIKFDFSHLIEDLAYYWEHFLYPMTVGGIPTGIIASIVFYFVLKYQIDKFREIRKAILHKRKVELRAKKFKQIKDKFLSTTEDMSE
ncbi:MAG TPA: hypothetical protein DCL21_02025 [Alphaproteobacteria bacterium]|mgnify:CR=1 FL=1|nr:hypothetical protein [Alphaproteobacteria bacterium]